MKVRGLIVALVIIGTVAGAIIARAARATTEVSSGAVERNQPVYSYSTKYQETIHVYQMPDGATCYTYSRGISCIRP
jgi:hypothetical protein